MRNSASPPEGVGAPRGSARRVLAALFSAAVIALTAWYFAGRWPEIRGRLRLVSPGVLALLAGTVLLNCWLAALRMGVQFSGFGVRLRGLEWFGLTACYSMFNYLPGRGGTAMLAVYLRRRHAFPLVRNLMLAAVLMPFYVGITSLFAAALLLLGGAGAHPRLIGFFAAGALLAPAGLAAVLLARRVRLGPRLHRVEGWVRHLTEGAEVLRERPGILLRLGGIWVGSLLVFALRTWIIFRVLGRPVSWIAAGVMQSIVELSSLVALTPGNLGVKESLSVLCSGLLGVPPEVVMAAALLDRAVAMAVVFALGAVFTHLLLGGRGRGEARR